MDKVYAFGPFRLDVSAEILFRGADPLPVGRRAVGVLRALLERAGVPVAKDSLMQAAWPGLAVEDNNLTVQIAALRRALADEPGGDGWIETLPRRGYRFVGPAVAAVETAPPGAPAASDAKFMSTAPALPDRPSIAVLPFQNLSGDPEQEYFADGMVEEITTALSRIRWLFVIARNSSFTYKGRAVDVVQVGRELGVRYLLEGSVRKAGARVRIAGQLVDAISGAHLWADNFEGSLADIFELQDRVAASVAGIIEPTLRVAEYRRAAQRPTEDLTAYDLYLRAVHESMTWERQRVERALDLLGEALARDPEYGSALAAAAMCEVMLYLSNWAPDLQAARQAGTEYSRRALRAAGDDPYVLANAAHALGLFGEDINVSLDLIDRSLQLNPNFAVGWVRSAHIRLWAGHYDVAIKHCERSIRLSPRENRAGPYFGMGAAYLFTRRFEEAVAMFRLALQERPSWAPTHRFLAACYAHMGLLDEAKDIVKRLRTITPVVIPNADHWRVREDREFFIAGLQLAADDETRST